MLDGIDKQKIVAKIAAALSAEREGVLEAARAAREGATHEDAQPENQYDTRALEASYLAGAQTARAEVLDAAIQTIESLDLRTFDADAAIALSALVELEHEGDVECYFVAPQGGGLKIELDARVVRVITPESPIAKRMLGKRVGDGFEMVVKRQPREYEIIAIA